MHRSNKILEDLYNVLYATYGAYLQTQLFHWNIKGIHFLSLHELFGVQYEELAKAVDTIAEQIIMLDGNISLSFKMLHDLSKIEIKESADAIEMLRILGEVHKVLIMLCTTCLESAEVNKLHVVVDLMAQRLAIHQKAVWVLDARDR